MEFDVTSPAVISNNNHLNNNNIDNNIIDNFFSSNEILNATILTTDLDNGGPVDGIDKILDCTKFDETYDPVTSLISIVLFFFGVLYCAFGKK